MGVLLDDWLLLLYYEVSALFAGVTKKSLIIGEDQKVIWSYYEKGSPVIGQPTMIFLHGFSSNKEAWLYSIKEISNGYHSISIDLPRHGETIGHREDDDRCIDSMVDLLKSFLDRMNLTERLCLIGTSIGGTMVALFTVKYPQYVSMLCLLAPPPPKEYESSLLGEVRSGAHYILLPETSKQFDEMADLLTVKRVKMPKTFTHKYFRSRLRLLNEQKKLLKSFLQYEYIHLERYYEQLKQVQCPALILWGREDRLCKVEGTNYFSQLIPNSEVTIFDDCGHFIAYDKPIETAKSIRMFLDEHSYFKIELPTSSQDSIELK